MSANNKKDREAEIMKQQELEKMLGISLDDSVSSHTIIPPQNNSNPLPVNIPNIPTPDLLKDLKEAEKEAEEFIDSVINLYFTSDIDKNLEAVQSKKKVEIKTLKNILFQEKTQQHIIMKLQDEIYSGGHVQIARLFEVLEKLQSGMMNTVKHSSAYRDVIYSSFRRLKEDTDLLDRQKMDPSLQLPEGDLKRLIDGGMKTRGTKDLIETLKQEVEAEDVKFEEVPEGPNLTDAKAKYKVELEIEQKEMENNEDRIIDNDLF